MRTLGFDLGIGLNGTGKFTPTLQKQEGFRVKASEGEVVVLYFKPSATQNLKSSGFPEGETTWQNRPHPSNSSMEASKNFPCCYDIGNNCRPLSNLCHFVYATKGFIVGRVEERNPTKGPKTPRHKKRNNDSFISPSI